jgi:hypothetical protein
MCESTVVTISVDAPEGADVLTLMRQEIAEVERAVGLRAIDVDLDLVDEGEIANRLEKSRQVINLYAKGERGCGDFPAPFALPGGRRLWTWASIARWVRHNKQDWDDDSELDHLSREQQRALSAWLIQRALTARPPGYDFVPTRVGLTCTQTLGTGVTRVPVDDFYTAFTGRRHEASTGR